jgi:hypothetical protein
MEHKFEDLENKIEERFEDLENELLDSFRYPSENLINSPFEEFNLLEKFSDLTNLIADLTNFQFLFISFNNGIFHYID